MSIPVFETISHIRAALALDRGGTLGLVPTMGALHAGHARLIQSARADCDVVAVSIFVNPLQFDRRDDFERYARTLPADVELCRQTGADLVFAPSADEMYPAPALSSVDVSALTEHFCGRARPGHFRGVATVVSKLFHIIQPQRAYFGEKDAQQLAVIERMVQDLNFDLRIVPVETVREPDGLAMSSRNTRLSPEDQQLAEVLYRALSAVRAAIASGEREVPRILDRGRRLLDMPGITVEYFDLADPATMVPVQKLYASARAMAAIWIGGTRLIDNTLCPLP